MPLNTVDPPIAAYEAVRSVVTGLAADSAFRTPALRRADPNALALSTPLRVAFLPLDRLQRDDNLRTAAQVRGWRFLIHDRDRVIATTDAVLNEKGGFQFGHLNEGPFTTGTEEAIRRAERLDAVREGRFEPLLLFVPALYVAALWLQDLNGDADMLLVMSPAPQEFKPYQAMAPQDFLAMLRRLAERVRTKTGKGGEPPGG